MKPGASPAVEATPVPSALPVPLILEVKGPELKHPSQHIPPNWSVQEAVAKVSEIMEPVKTRSLEEHRVIMRKQDGGHVCQHVLLENPHGDPPCWTGPSLKKMLVSHDFPRPSHALPTAGG